VEPEPIEPSSSPAGAEGEPASGVEGAAEQAETPPTEDLVQEVQEEVEPPEEPAPTTVVRGDVLEPEPEADEEGGPPASGEIHERHDDGYGVDVSRSSSPAQVPGKEEARRELETSGPEQAPPVTEVPAGGSDRDGTEAWIAAVEAEARSEAEPPSAPTTPPVREIDLEPEPEALGAVEPTEVIRIEDRDAAGEHEPRGEQDADATSGKRRWALFRRGGSR